ncbi:MAG TPA: hypothetical protein VJU58_13850 [Microbacterium sp.]|nr:hypothetical protein [Microbacterium sp.]
MTYRELLLWLERYAESHEDGELDMPVVMRIERADTEFASPLPPVEAPAGSRAMAASDKRWRDAQLTLPTARLERRNTLSGEVERWPR